MIRKSVLLSGLRSDSHTWGLAFLDLWFEEHGFEVINLGSCVPSEEIVSAWRRHQPDMIALSSVNGHGALEALQLMEAFRAGGWNSEIPIVIGGKLTTSVEREAIELNRLLQAGFTSVFTGNDALPDCEAFLSSRGLLEDSTMLLGRTA